jgi:predicted unusual protein kinase regulating ubiquinone biosynthesis (AarF/ABC1/UbiB family)
MAENDREANRLSARAARYARVGAQAGGVAARVAGGRLSGRATAGGTAGALAAALGNLKGPLMKVAQLLATIPDALPADYVTELQKLQADAPPMGWTFVKRRMISELGVDWESRFASFERMPAAAASLGQVHRATALDGAALAVKLQYPEMQSAVEADLVQLKLLLALHRRFERAIDTQEIYQEISARIREELDYQREAGHARLYAGMLADVRSVRVPKVRGELSTRRLISMDWLDGERLLTFKEHAQEERNLIATAMFKAWWHPFGRFGVIHGDPHLGNYSVFSEGGRPAGINLLDYGCIRVFPARFVGGVVDLYHGLRSGDEARVVHAYESWGFRGLSRDLIDILNIWARFIYGPLLEDRVRNLAEGVNPAEYGRREAYRVHRALKEKGPVTVPREFVFMDRAAIGLGSVFLHLRASLNFYRLFNEEIDGFDAAALAARQHEQRVGAGLIGG